MDRRKRPARRAVVRECTSGRMALAGCGHARRWAGLSVTEPTSMRYWGDIEVPDEDELEELEALADLCLVDTPPQRELEHYKE